MEREIQPQTVLVVNDTPQKLDRIAEIAEGSGDNISIIKLPDGSDAVQWAQDSNFHTALVDYDMPTNGIETIAALRRIEEEQNRQRSTIALVTSYGGERYQQCLLQAIEAGADGGVSMHFSNRKYQAQIARFVTSSSPE